jgi:hypothetical protein
MTEAEWLKSTDPQAMLAFVHRKLSRRKAWLFALACCRRCPSVLRSQESRALIELAERAADEPGAEPALRAAWLQWTRKPQGTPAPWKGVVTEATNPGRRGFNRASIARVARISTAGVVRSQSERRAQSLLIRCIVGDPFRRVILKPSLLTLADGLLPRLAQAAYEERELSSGHLDQARLGVLADACDESEVVPLDLVAHLRSPGPHYRGMWSLDLLLGKR